MTAETESRPATGRDIRHRTTHPADGLVSVKPMSGPGESGTDWYQDRKRDLILAALPRRHYQLALDPGCGAGSIALALAARCNRVVAWDVDPTAVSACRSEIAAAAADNVEVREGRAPEDWPSDLADLIVLSEIGYHMDGPTLDTLINTACAGLAVGGTLIAAHRRGTAVEFELDGDDVHAHLFGRVGLARIGGYADDELRIDVFVAE